MRLLTSLFVMVAASLFLSSCAVQFPFIAPAAQSEMLDLQALCTQQNITLSEKKVADSLATAGTALLKKNKREDAWQNFDRACAYYRIALTKNAITAIEKQIASEEQALAKTKEDVSAYKQVLSELKSMEQK